MDENKYIEQLNIREELFKDVYDYAIENHVPIIDSDSLNILKNFIYLKNVKQVLEVGTAIGYSGLHMLSVSSELRLTTIEMNEESFKLASKNFEKYDVTNRVENILGDAKEVEVEGTFDMLFIDASKGNNQLFLEKFKPLLSPSGMIVVDNILLRGLIVEKEIKNRNKRKLKEKVDRFNHYVKENYPHTMYFNVGDGLLIITV